MRTDTIRAHHHATILAVLTLILTASQVMAQNWAPLGEGADDQVRALAFDGFNLYVAGDFANVDGSTGANNIAVWNATTGIWAPLLQGTDGSVYALAIHPSTGDLYVGGSFANAGGAAARNIAIWDGASWSTLGTAPDDGIFGQVNALTFNSSGDLYVGGTLGATGDGLISDVHDIAMWDGSAWSVLGTAPDDGVGNSVNALAVSTGGDLYVGGTFVDVENGSVEACRVAMWNGTWSAVGAGVNATVRTLELDGSDNLYVGGEFTLAADGLDGGSCSLSGPGFQANRIAMWDGANWSALVDVFAENGVGNNVNAILADPLGDIVVAGQFTDAGGCPSLCSDTDRIALWQPLIHEWAPLDKGFGNNVVNALALAPTISVSKAAIDISILIAAGSFTQDGNSTSMNRIAALETVLPVELTAFDALVEDRDVVLRWATASETSNSGFEVQHDDTGEQSPGWAIVDFVAGAGTTQDPQAYSYRITGLEPGIHRFRLRQIDFDGAFEYSSILEVMVEIPGTHVLTDAYPNPFNPQAAFSLTVARDQTVRVELFDVTGRQVQSLYDGTISANVVHRFVLDGDRLSGGVYVYRVTGENFVESRKVVLMK